uniref:Ig-like domain-containing protein n=1 Tax=Pundamilia nyererei TaxID=303518 RepID=A0A3B4H5X2_9CICH
MIIHIFNILSCHVLTATVGFFSSALIEMREIPQQMSLHEAKLGDDVNLTCVKNNAEFSYWYKLNFGYLLETVAKGTYGRISLSGQFNNSRFSATKVGHVHSLIIRNVSKEDEATYLCHAGSVYETEFINGTILAVKGKVYLFYCFLFISVSKSKQIQTCIFCPGEDKVHWFKGGSESHPGVIYHGNVRNKEDGRCDYSLSKTVTNSSDAGTYYCAVVTCSEILFGEGTKVVTSIITLHVQLQTMTMFCVFNINCKTVLKWLLNSNSVFLGVNYAALDFPSRKAKKWKKKWELPDDSIYSGMIDYQ